MSLRIGVEKEQRQKMMRRGGGGGVVARAPVLFLCTRDLKWEATELGCSLVDNIGLSDGLFLKHWPLLVNLAHAALKKKCRDISQIQSVLHLDLYAGCLGIASIHIWSRIPHSLCKAKAIFTMPLHGLKVQSTNCLSAPSSA